MSLTPSDQAAQIIPECDATLSVHERDLVPSDFAVAASRHVFAIGDEVIPEHTSAVEDQSPVAHPVEEPGCVKDA